MLPPSTAHHASPSWRVARFIVGALRKFVPPERVSRLLEINGQPGTINYVNHRPHSVVIIDATGDQIATIYIVSNPEKLRGLN